MPLQTQGKIFPYFARRDSSLNSFDFFFFFSVDVGRDEEHGGVAAARLFSWGGLQQEGKGPNP